MHHRKSGFLFATVVLLAVSPMALLHCGTDGAAADGGGDGDRDGDGDGDGDGRGDDSSERTTVSELCKRYVVAGCDYENDCRGEDEDECIERGNRACEDVITASSKDVDRCVSELAEIACGETIPDVCRDAVTFSVEDGGSDEDGDEADDGDGACLELVESIVECAESCRDGLAGAEGGVFCSHKCEADSDCEVGFCIVESSIPICALDCSNQPCPAGYSCLEGVSACVPE